MDEKKTHGKVYYNEISLQRERTLQRPDTFREGEMIIFKASGVRMTGISMAILNLEEHRFQNSEKDFQCRVHTPVNYQSNLEDLKKFISCVLFLRNF